ncbi:hypothetical protein FIBSPDRAFT_962002 [Athelia psychrophila]|uniref:Xylanolytic transcriptional activator regulatory domain-containing protein n=1 Tax=Athelia psychrophila TaxID=1759441 RepID=A0A166AL86_9AGAM|nr:hypothetical protein FIBSPDRAFT_962002 [Fibularhizoctonia sp. CBS 109695]
MSALRISSGVHRMSPEEDQMRCTGHLSRSVLALCGNSAKAAVSRGSKLPKEPEVSAVFPFFVPIVLEIIRPVKATDAPSSTNQRTSISASLSTPLVRNIELTISSASTLPRPLVPLVPLTQASGLATVISVEQLAQAIWPSVFELGGAHVSIEQATTLFDEFFEHFHPSCPMFLTSRAPVPTHRTDPLLFWAILAVASRGPPLPSGMQKILEGVSYVALAEQIKASVAALGIYPPHTPGVVQALLLLTWHYSSLVRPDFPLRSAPSPSHFLIIVGGTAQAIQTALQIGLHRPQFPHEFTSRTEEQVAAETVEGQERTLAWIYCHILGYSIASIHGIPSLLKDDYVTLSASNRASASPPAWLAQIPRRAIDALRIARLTDRIACTLGHAASTPSGQLPAESTAPLFSVFNAELGELDRGLGGGSEAHTTLRLHLCRIRLCAFMLQSAGEAKGTVMTQPAAGVDDREPLAGLQFCAHDPAPIVVPAHANGAALWKLKFPGRRLASRASTTTYSAKISVQADSQCTAALRAILRALLRACAVRTHPAPSVCQPAENPVANVEFIHVGSERSDGASAFV